MIPAWTFFAPNPGRTDTHVLYRDAYSDRGTTPWRVVALRSRPPWFSSSDGQRRVSKGVVDVQADLITPQPGEEVGDDDAVPGDPSMRTVARTVFLDSSYLMLLNLATRQRHDAFAVATQFAIATTAGPAAVGDPTILFVSAWHELPGTAATSAGSGGPMAAATAGGPAEAEAEAAP